MANQTLLFTLIASRAANDGEFSGLPEGSQISANFREHRYTWTLTYRGGNSGHDVVLRNVLDRAGDMLPRRNSIDRCIVTDLRKGIGQIIQCPREALNRCTQDK